MPSNIVTRFHRRHNKKITLSEDNTVAYIKGNFLDDLTVFGEEPLQPTEIFAIEIEQTQRRWNDQVRLTLTTMNPNNLPENYCKWPLHWYVPHLSHFELSNIGLYKLLKIWNRRFQYNRAATPLDIAENNTVMTGKGPLRLQMLKPTKSNVGMSAIRKSTRIGVVYIPISGTRAKVHHIVNGEHQGAYSSDIAYKEAPLYPKIDIYGNTEKMRVIQLYGVPTLQSACRDTVRQYTTDAAVSSLGLPNLVKEYLLYRTPNE